MWGNGGVTCSRVYGSKREGERGKGGSTSRGNEP